MGNVDCVNAMFMEWSFCILGTIIQRATYEATPLFLKKHHEKNLNLMVVR